jgi:hypothetical protein
MFINDRVSTCPAACVSTSSALLRVTKHLHSPRSFLHDRLHTLELSTTGRGSSASAIQTTGQVVNVEYWEDEGNFEDYSKKSSLQ